MRAGWFLIPRLGGGGDLHDLNDLNDLNDDPHEMDNWFNDAALAGHRRELQDMIASRPDDACAALPQVGIA